MRHPPNKTYLEETLDEMEIQEENFLEQSKNKLQSKKRRRKAKVTDDHDATQYGQ